jgi:hypothetical protein
VVGDYGKGGGKGDGVAAKVYMNKKTEEGVGREGGREGGREMVSRVGIVI